MTDVSPRILIVEDERGMREGMFRVLTQKGLQASMASNGNEAFEILQKEDYPLVLVDLKMPGMDGFELLDHINRTKPGTICVVVSAFATVESIVKTTKMGTFDFVVKPFIPDDLMVVVNRAIDKWTALKETARLKAEREAHLLQLTAEKSRLKTIVQAMGDGVLVVNIDNNVVLDNSAARLILRRIDDPTLFRPVCEVIPDPKVCDEIRALLVSPSPTEIRLEMQIAPRSEEESVIDVKVTLAPFTDEQGRTLGAVVLLSDISDSKAYERMKTMFVSMVAHEIKAPIAAIESYLNVIESGALDSDLPKVKNIAARCLERSAALLVLVQDLLAITRQETMQRNRVIEKVDMRSLVSKLVEFHRPQAGERKITIDLSVPEQMRPLLADTADMERVLTNLISNAIKYNREGGRIWIRLHSSQSAMEIEVQDTGIGMKADDVRRIGEEFFRVKNDKTRLITGTGLGLALVKRIVKSYHGAVEIDSVVEQGTTFRLLLPYEEESLGDGGGATA